jgi:hypothetical protein
MSNFISNDYGVETFESSRAGLSDTLKTRFKGSQWGLRSYGRVGSRTGRIEGTVYNETRLFIV